MIFFPRTSASYSFHSLIKIEGEKGFTSLFLLSFRKNAELTSEQLYYGDHPQENKHRLDKMKKGMLRKKIYDCVLME